MSRFFGDKEGVDKALIIEKRSASAKARINLIQHATTSIDLAYYAVGNGVASDIFYATILEAAQRGVRVRLLFDGIFHNLKGSRRAIYKTLLSHPNIEIRFYEPLNPLKPWTLHNRLHDKFVIVDNTYALIGGRNIGDKYYLESYEKKVVEDRDLLIIKSSKQENSGSVLSQFTHYFSSLWDHPYTKEKRVRATKATYQEVLLKLDATKEEYPDHFLPPIDWSSYALATNKVTLITNPIQRLNKEPWILMEMVALSSITNSTILAQSPYIIPSYRMKSYLKELNDGVEISYLTNSKFSSPNYFALAGYLKHREKLGPNVFEYHGSGSIHAKSYIFDRRLSMIGSFNLDARSAFLSTESMVVIDSEELATALTQNIELLTEDSLISTQPKNREFSIPWYKRVLIALCRVLLFPFDSLL